MLRRTYLATLVALQLALAFDVAPSLSRVLRTYIGAAGLHHDVPALLQLGATGLAAMGLALVLSFPAIAVLRHQQRGEARFRGVPRWAVVLAVTGAAILTTAMALTLAQPFAPEEWRHALGQIARPALTAGAAVIAAGALCAELLRRSVAPLQCAALSRRLAAARIEVVDPPELRTRAA